MTDVVLKVRSNHSACCAPWPVTTVDQKNDTGWILDIGPNQTRPEYRVAVLCGERVHGPQARGQQYLGRLVVPTSYPYWSVLWHLLCCRNGGDTVSVEVIQSS